MRVQAVLSIVGILVLVAACAATPDVSAEAGPEARRALAEAAARGPVLAVVDGTIGALTPSERDRLVTGAMARGVTGLDVRFTTDPAQAAAPDPYLAVVLNAPPVTPAAAACRRTARPGGAPAGDRLHVLAAFCRGQEVLGAARGSIQAPLDDPRQLERLLWSTAAALFPDDYAESYGFDILPGWLDLGIGGSFGF